MANKVKQTPILPSGFLPRSLDAIIQGFAGLVRALYTEFVEHANRLNMVLPKDGSEAMTGPIVLSSYTVVTVPSAALYTSGLIYVSNETGGAVPAFSDGTNWRRVTDRAVIA